MFSGERILSAYAVDPAKPCEGFGANTLWIITERDRSATTLLLPTPPGTLRRREAAKKPDDVEYGESHTVSGLIGAIWQVRDDLAFDIGFRHAAGE